MVPIRFTLCLAIAWLLVTAIGGNAASTDCTFTPNASKPIFLGVQSQTITVECPWQNATLTSTAHVVRINLTTKNLSMVALAAGSPINPQALLVSKTLKPDLNQVGVNANLFDPCCAYAGGGLIHSLLGLAWSNNEMWSPVGAMPSNPPPGNFLSSLIVANGRASIVTLKKGDSPPAGLSLAVTGTHRILTNAKNTAPNDMTPADWYGPNARTLVGYNKGLNGPSQIVFPRLWLVTVDAGSKASAGVTLPQAAGLLLFLGASDGINLDGGGSTTMVSQAANGKPTFINVPKDWAAGCEVAVVQGSSCERYVGFGLAVVAPPLP